MAFHLHLLLFSKSHSILPTFQLISPLFLMENIQCFPKIEESKALFAFFPKLMLTGKKNSSI
ncbi:hypothetical protein BVRB_8g183800 [Beta vulgaris subsp. vulgaris]|nr:hypothetical protein BVRB_8g183800 [Beta vulgaris subsp. vulgaris]